MSHLPRNPTMSGTIVIFGAGATGRGHVGLLAWQAGFEIVLIDKNEALVEALSQEYAVRLCGPQPRESP